MAIIGFVPSPGFTWPPPAPGAAVRAPAPTDEECLTALEKLGRALRRCRKLVRRLPAGSLRQAEFVRDAEELLAAGVRPGVYVPTAADEDILEALDGEAMTTDRLAAAAKCSRSHMLKRINDHLKPRGRVRHLDGYGFFRPDRPPADLPV